MTSNPSVSMVIRANRLLDLAILACLRSAFESPLEDEMTDLLVTLTTDDHLEMLGAVARNCFSSEHPMYLAFVDWRAAMAVERAARENLLTALAQATPTPEQTRLLVDDIERLATRRAEAMTWTAHLGSPRYPSVAAHFRAVANADRSRMHADANATAGFTWR
jgi:hypothetical protein